MHSELLFSYHSVLEALKANKRSFFKLYISKGNKREREIKSIAEKKNIKVEYRNIKDIETLAGNENTQGIALEAGAIPFFSFDKITKEETPFLLILDHLQDTHNFGAIVRTALCANVSAIIIPQKRAVKPTPIVSKISVGALEHINIVSINNVATSIDKLKEKGFWVYGLDGEGKRSIYDEKASLVSPLALVLGSEGQGIKRLVGQKCDELYFIPQSSLIDSLNASVASGVAMYEIYRRNLCT